MSKTPQLKTTVSREPDMPLREYPFCSTPMPPIRAVTTDRVRFSFDELHPYAFVQEQYQKWGIRFEGAIALQPSNPAFALDSSTIVIMPIAGRLEITIHVHQPVKTAGAWVTGARQIKLTAFDRHHRVVAQQTVGLPQYLQPLAEQVEVFPRHHLELTVDEEIATLAFCSDAPFVLHNFFCE